VVDQIENWCVTRDMTASRVMVIGAGPAGISAGLALKHAGIAPLILDRNDTVAASWRSRYDRLRLNTCRYLSHLPDRRFPKGTPLFPTRDDLVKHLETCSRQAGLNIRLGTNVERLDHDAGAWWIKSAGGDAIRTKQVVVATGYEATPLIPAWDGRDDFRGELLHAADYRNPKPFAGEAVLVVGSGCSGMEIAYDLAVGGASKVWLSARTPPNIVMRQGPAGCPGDVIALTLLHLPVRFADAFTRLGRRMELGDLTELGLPIPEEGVFARLHRLGVVPSIVDQEVIDAIKEGRIEVVRGVEALDGTGVRLTGGMRVEPNVVVCATGYRRGLEPLVGHLGVLDEAGIPTAQGAEAPREGLRFIGYTARPAALGYMARQAKRAARAIARELQASSRVAMRSGAS
jgi:cation diffusion facilitator CzcD-associated flavoprotein CzcO